MASIRKTPGGRWQATVRLPDGKRCSTTRDSRADARLWADTTETTARQLASAAPAATLTWSPDGLTVFIPEDRITMDAARHLEEVLRQLFPVKDGD